jgi:hypothetical protein
VLRAQSTGGLDDLNRRLEQVRRDTRLLASPEQSTVDRTLIDYGGYATISYFSTDTASGENRALRQYDLNLFARLNFDGAHEFYVRNRLQYRDYNRGDETLYDDDSLQNFLEEAYYRFDLARFLASTKGESTANNLVVTGGRQFVDWASGLVLSQYLDGVKLDGNLGPLEGSVLAGVTTYGTTDFDVGRPHFDKSTYRGFYGGMLAYRVGQHRPFVYGLVQEDYNKQRDVTLVSGNSAQFKYNSYYIGVGSTGNLTDHVQYSAEWVYEGGRTKSGPTLNASSATGDFVQDEQDISAWAGQTSLDYLFNDIRRSRVGAGFIIASGDSDRSITNSTLGGSAAGTQDHAFNALGLVSAGYAFNPPISNIMVLKLGGSTFPWGDRTGPVSRLQFGADVLFYGKTLRRGPIDETTSSDTYLGTEIGPYMNWRVVEDITVQLRYGIFFPGTAIRGLPNENDNSEKTRQFLYTSFTYSF